MFFVHANNVADQSSCCLVALSTMQSYTRVLFVLMLRVWIKPYRWLGPAHTQTNRFGLNCQTPNNPAVPNLPLTVAGVARRSASAVTSHERGRNARHGRHSAS